MSQPATPPASFSTLWLLAGLAIAWTLSGVGKPLVIDDPAYERFADQLARRPLDPYGFDIFWYDEPMPAIGVLAPPVLPAWWALVRRLFGEEPLVWKLGMLPWAALLVAAVYGLARRFCREQAAVVTVFIVLSPALFPALNLMLDIPALGLSLSALWLFLRALDAGWWGLCCLAGLVAGLACQAKYTGFLAPPAMLLASSFRRRPLFWLPAGLLAANVFLTWEVFTALLYGRSHFLLALGEGGSLAEKVEMLPFLFSYLGGLAPAAVLLALAALGVRRRVLLLAGLVLVGGLVVVALLDVTFTVGVLRLPFLRPVPDQTVKFQPAEVIFVTQALALALLLGAVAWASLLRVGPSSEGRREVLFLVSWLLLEVLGYMALTPFPAARRVLGVWVVLVLLVGQLASHTLRGRRGVVGAVLAFQAVLALGYTALDWRGAWVHAEGARSAARVIAARGGGTTWFVGHWGFQFYAERAGMRPVIPGGEGREGSLLHAGDWLVVPSTQVDQQDAVFPPEKLEPVERIVLADPVPLRTVRCYYGGRVPLEHHEGPRLEVGVWRVKADFTPGPGKAGNLFAAQGR